jgi:hypothetical protein
MKLVFFGTSLDRASGHHGRVLRVLFDGLAGRGHHLVFFASGPAGHPPEADYKLVHEPDWTKARAVAEAECETAAAVIVTSGFAAGHEAVDWLLDIAPRAKVYYDLDPWQTLAGFKSEGAAPWVRAEQIPLFDLVLSLAGGEATSSFKERWGAQVVATAYEAIDPATFYPRAPQNAYVSDMALVAGEDAVEASVADEWVAATARALPGYRFLLAGRGWGERSWPDNVAVIEEDDPETRANVYSSARLVLVPKHRGSVELAMPPELLEPTACAAACVVLDRPGLAELFEPDTELLLPASPRDLLPFLTSFGGSRLGEIGNNGQKRVLLKYAKLPRSRQVEQLIAREFFGG